MGFKETTYNQFTNEKCRSCRFFVYINAVHGLCKYYPPTLSYEVNAYDSNYTWPRNRADDFCGCHKRWINSGKNDKLLNFYYELEREIVKHKKEDSGCNCRNGCTTSMCSMEIFKKYKQEYDDIFNK